MEVEIIAHIRTDFPNKFGIPRQSGLCDLVSYIVFEKKYRNPDALRGLEQYSHLWLLWQFSLNKEKGYSATVRPPRLGGNERVGVFATRSPYRPSPIGLSSVELVSIEPDTPEGPIIAVRGADLADNTPIIDIKPYLPYTDSHPDAKGGFANAVMDQNLEVVIPDSLLERIPEEKRSSLISILAQDPRPHYQNDPERIYGMSFAGFEIKFTTDGKVLTVCDVAAS